jgi:hypothetical protein
MPRPRLSVIPDSQPVVTKLSSPPTALTTASANNSAPGSLAPKVVVVNPTPHPTPPATPVPVIPATALPEPSASATMLPLPRNSAPASHLTPLPPATANLQPALAPGITALVRPTPTPARASEDHDTSTLKASERRFFLKQSPDDDSPDRQSGGALSPHDPRLGGSSVTSDGTSITASSESAEAPDNDVTTKAPPPAPPKRTTSTATASSAAGLARGRKGKDTLRAAPAQRRLALQRPSLARRSTTDSKEKEKEKPRANTTFKIGSTSSNGSKSRPAAKPRQATMPKVDAARSKGRFTIANGKHAPEAQSKRGIVVDSSSDSESDSDADSDWASEDMSDPIPANGQKSTAKGAQTKRTKEELEAIRLREAAEEAQRQRDMFTKLPKRSYSGLNRTGSGLLSMLLNPDPSRLPPGHPYARAGFSSDDVAGMRPPPPHNPSSRNVPQQHGPAPPAKRQTSGGVLGPMARMGMGMTTMKPAPAPPAPTQAQAPGQSVSMLKTSKSAVALPAVTAAPAPAQPNSSAQGKTGYRPKGRPEEQEMEDETDSGEESGVMPESLAQRKLEALMQGRRKEKTAQGPPPEMRQLPRDPYGAQQHQMHRSQTQPAAPRATAAPTPVPYPVGHPYNLPPPAAPTTPRTTRRQMLSTELSESLRRNLLWERQVSMINMVGPRKRPGALSGGLRPMTTVNGDGNAAGGASRSGDEREREREEARRKALARNRSWADDYHYAGW